MGSGWVLALVPSRLPFDVDVDSAEGAEDGAAPPTCHKGRCHIVKGRSRSGSFDADSGSTSPKITSSHCMHESTADPYFSCVVELLQIGVVEFDAVLESQPAIPAATVLLVGTFGDTLVPGHLCAIDAIQEIIAGGGGTILICDGDRDGWREVSIEISCSSER